MCKVCDWDRMLTNLIEYWIVTQKLAPGSYNFTDFTNIFTLVIILATKNVTDPLYFTKTLRIYSFMCLRQFNLPCEGKNRQGDYSWSHQKTDILTKNINITEHSTHHILVRGPQN